MTFNPPTYKPGDPLRAADLNSRNEAIRNAGTLTGSTGINVREAPGGRELSLTLPECTDIKLTTSANANGGYGGKEVLGASLGTWLDTPRTMPQNTDPLYERDHNTSLTSSDRVYRACRCEQTAEWIFAHRVTAGDDCSVTLTVNARCGTIGGPSLGGSLIEVLDSTGTMLLDSRTGSSCVFIID